ncbi:MAG: hypothetical protein ACJAVI_001938 [Candidatus Azotimanducaceae bacterium]|jgi:hypothetical protein
MSIKLATQENESGDSNLAAQGFGRVVENAVTVFTVANDPIEIYQFFEEHGYVVLAESLGSDDVNFLNNFFDSTQKSKPLVWGLSGKRKPHHRNQGLIYSQPLLDHPELDRFTRHPNSFAVVSNLLGGKEQVRFAEFNLRETPANGGVGTMNFHHDKVVEDRFLRTPYLPCDYLCAIHYLSDVGDSNPAFCVVPGSHKYETLKEAHEEMGDSYRELPIRGAAGTCILYDTAIFHTRLDGDGVQPRRTWHQYYARGGWLQSALPTTSKYRRSPSPVLTDWNLFPERLAMHADPEIRLFFSHWNTAQGEWVASGFDTKVRQAMPRGEQ